MPVISKSKIVFNGQEWIQTISCNNKGIFSMKLPKELVTRLNIDDHIEANSKQELLTDWKKLQTEFIASVTSERQVIAYKLEMNARIYVDEEDQPRINLQEISFTDGLAISLAVGVFNEITTISNGSPTIRYDWEHSTIPTSAEVRHLDYWDIQGHKVAIVDYTREREQFFTDLITALEDITLKLHNFLGAGEMSVTGLLKAIDAHTDNGFKLLKATNE